MRPKGTGVYQHALYDAQDEALYEPGWGRTFNNVAQTRHYVDDLVASDWFQHHWPQVWEIHVDRRGAGSRWSLGGMAKDGQGEGQILMAHLHQVAVLHEIAHVICHADRNLDPHIGHNPAYARVLLALVRHEVGFHAYGAFLSALRTTPAFRQADLAINQGTEA